MSTKALTRYLSVLTPFLDEEGVTEICINEPHEILVEKKGTFTAHEIPELSLKHLETLAELIAELNHQTISPEKPLLSGTLLNGERIQIARSPACEKDNIIMAIRRHGLQNFALEDYVKKGAFDGLEPRKKERQRNREVGLVTLYESGHYHKFIEGAIAARKNIIISGGTGTGKTTFLNACLKLIPAHERLISIEDAREVIIPHKNKVHLLAAKGEQGQSPVSMLDLFEACLRLRPDRILLSELRGKEAFSFLRAANSGHPGSLTTVHADTPKACFEQIVFMMQQAGSTSSDKRLLRYIKSIIPIVIQLKRSTDKNKYVEIAHIYFDKAQEDS